jgi:hypothetical protein
MADLWYMFIPENFSMTLAEFKPEDVVGYDEIKEDYCIKILLHIFT